MLAIAASPEPADTFLNLSLRVNFAIILFYNLPYIYPCLSVLSPESSSQGAVYTPFSTAASAKDQANLPKEITPVGHLSTQSAHLVQASSSTTKKPGASSALGDSTFTESSMASTDK